MSEITFIDKGTKEVIVVDNKEIRVDRFSVKHLLDVLSSHNCINLKSISYDEYMRGK